MQSQPHRMMGTRIRVNNPNVTRVTLNTGIKCDPLITVGQLLEWSTWKTIESTALMVWDSGDLEDGVGDVGFDPNDYEGMEELSPLPSTTPSLLPPHVKAAHIAYHYEQQEQ